MRSEILGTSRVVMVLPRRGAAWRDRRARDAARAGGPPTRARARRSAQVRVPPAVAAAWRESLRGFAFQLRSPAGVWFPNRDGSRSAYFERV